MTDTGYSDIQKIGDLLRLARDAKVIELTAEIPYHMTSGNNGLMQVRAKWADDTDRD